ncbi:MAG TPA: single-stranded DNA-binding protein [Corynebacteriales bacterium]|nr:single-stranded DNA-binding protein [Mycobacteriales bacterium]
MTSRQQKLIDEGEIAADYLEAFLDILDFDGDIDLDVEGDRASVAIDGGDQLYKLSGKDGNVLEAVQTLTRLAVQQNTGERSRLMLDIDGWRAGRKETLRGLAEEGARRVFDLGTPVELEPMTPFERKVVHDAIAEIEGVVTESSGEGKNRHVVIFPDDEYDDDDDYEDDYDDDDVDGDDYDDDDNYDED